MGFLGKLVSSAIKVAVTPLAIGADILTEGEKDLTINNLNDAVNTFCDGVKDLEDGDLI